MASRYTWLMWLLCGWLAIAGLGSRVDAQVHAMPANTVEPQSAPSNDPYGFSAYRGEGSSGLSLDSRMQQMAQRGQQAIEAYRMASRVPEPLPSVDEQTTAFAFRNAVVGPIGSVDVPQQYNIATSQTSYAPGMGPVATEPIMMPNGEPFTPTCDLSLGVAAPQACQGPCFSGVGPEACYSWQILPDGLMYKSYLAGVKEPRFSTVWFYERGYGWLWDSTLGGRVGILRHGTRDPLEPQGWQIDIEGAAFPRLDTEHGRDLNAVDFRFGIPLTSRYGPWQTKFGYYHLSSHLGDEYMERLGTLNRINYARDCLVLGVGYFLTPDLRLYAETAWAFYVNGGSEPWEFQFGAEYSPAMPSGFFGAPFLAVNGHLREEVEYGGNFVAQTGWQWRGETGNLFRLGLQYYNGMSNQYQFYDQFEDQFGFGLWYDY